MEKRGIKTEIKILFLVILISFILGISFVGAINSCCAETNGGASCQEIDSAVCDSLCDGECLQTSCENTQECKIGCCIQGDGTCSLNSPKGLCSSSLSGGWEEDASCNIPDCQTGCCVLKEDVEFVNEAKCRFLARSNGIATDFREITEAECFSLSRNPEKGACLLGDRGCKVTTKSDCMSMTQDAGAFRKGQLCTNPELNTTCEKTQETRCVQGKDEIYLVDSCGNIANIYDANRINDNSYWTNVSNKTQSCGAGTGNVGDKKCGNCDYTKGSRCSQGEADYGSFVCEDLNCKNAPWVVDNSGKILKTKDRKQGESWCVYDGSVGNGTDIVGSRYWKYTCIDKQVQVAPCEDYRQEVCAEVVNLKTNETLTNSESLRCETNDWRACVETTANKYFGRTGDDTKIKDVFKEFEKQEARDSFKKECVDLGACEYYELKLKKTPIVPICKPRFPGGLKFWENSKNKDTGNAKQTCNVATSIPYIGTCTKITKCGCISGCECGTERWLEEANRICASFGDCGAYVNIVEEVSTSGYSAWKGKEDANSSKSTKLKISANYTLSLKEFAKKIQQENLVIKYENTTNYSVGWLGKVGGGGGGLTGPFAIFANTLGQIPIIGDFFNFIWESLGLISDCPTKKTYYHFQCLPYQAPIGGKDCEKCNSGDLKPCSEYRCKSLGAACQFINEGTGQDRCVWLNKNDTLPPTIRPWQEIINEKYIEQSCNSGNGKCYFLNGTKNRCIDPYTTYPIGIKADEFAQCKVDTNHTQDFEEMLSWLDDDFFLKEHDLNVSFPSPGHIYELSGINLSNSYDFYIRCRDLNGNANRDELRISLCVDAGEDKNSPRIVRTNPRNNGYTRYNVSSLYAEFFINEPSECKWDIADKGYGQMANSMACETGLGNYGEDFTYLCNATLPVSQTKKFFVKCKDQPWLSGENESRRNAMAESWIYELSGSDKLEITKIQPNSTIKTASEPATLELSVRTEGGGGSVLCRYSFSSWFGMSGFSEEDGGIHRQVLDRVSAGDKHLFVQCQDEAGNLARAESNFRVELDRTGPIVTRIYSGNGLVISTDEDSSCVYKLDNCEYNFANGTSMTGSGKEHSASWNLMAKYYIKCKDVFGNLGECFSVRAYDKDK